MKVSIVGLGRYGAPLSEALYKKGFEVIGSSRNHEKKFAGVTTFPLTYPELPLPELLEADILILNIPPFKEELSWFQKWDFKKRPWVIFISSTSESETLIQQEEWVKKTFSEWTVLRFAGLYGGNRHPGKHLAGKKGIKGRLWPVSLLHLDAAINFTLEVIQNEIKHETIPVISEQHLTKEKFYTEYAVKMGLPLPEFDSEDESLKEVRPVLTLHDLRRRR